METITNIVKSGMGELEIGSVYKIIRKMCDVYRSSQDGPHTGILKMVNDKGIELEDVLFPAGNMVLHPNGGIPYSEEQRKMFMLCGYTNLFFENEYILQISKVKNPEEYYKDREVKFRKDYLMRRR